MNTYWLNLLRAKALSANVGLNEYLTSILIGPSLSTWPALNHQQERPNNISRVIFEPFQARWHSNF